MQGDGVSQAIARSVLCVGSTCVIEIQAVEIICVVYLSIHGKPRDEGVHTGRDQVGIKK
jgi:hypothetical protein